MQDSGTRQCEGSQLCELVVCSIIGSSIVIIVAPPMKVDSAVVTATMLAPSRTWKCVSPLSISMILVSVFEWLSFVSSMNTVLIVMAVLSVKFETVACVLMILVIVSAYVIVSVMILGCSCLEMNSVRVLTVMVRMTNRLRDTDLRRTFGHVFGCYLW